MACQLLRQDRRFSGYWFAPRGPVFSAAHRPDRALVASFLSGLLTERLPGSTLFYRFEPALRSTEAHGLFPRRVCRTHAMNPARTLLVDLRKNEATLQSAMHEKTRYNIRVAERHGVVVRVGSAGDVDAFLRLAEETAARDKFRSHDPSYLRATYETLAASGMARLRLAEYEGRVLAASLEIVYGDTVTYLHGASSSEARNLMAPYALHWDAIRSAKAEGKSFYDFWGVNPERTSDYYYKPSWEGITRFKRGFGGELVELIGTWDLPINRMLYVMAFPRQFTRG